MNKYLAKFMQFMQGRYGIDSLYKFLLILYCAVLFIFSMIGFLFESVSVRRMIVFVPTAIIIFAFWRVFSKNSPARQEENRKYLVFKYKFTSFFNLQKNRCFQKMSAMLCGFKIKKNSGRTHSKMSLMRM